MIENNFIDIWSLNGRKKIHSLNEHREIVTYVVKLNFSS